MVVKVAGVCTSIGYPTIFRAISSPLFKKNLIVKLRTDPAVNDLPRDHAAPATLHLKDETKPRLVALCKTNPPLRRWKGV